MFEYYNDGNVVFKLEIVDGKLFAHVSISKWNKSTLVKCVDVWEQFKAHAIDSGYTEMYSIVPIDQKVLKFNLMFGAEILKELDECFVLRFTL